MVSMRIDVIAVRIGVIADPVQPVHVAWPIFYRKLSMTMARAIMVTDSEELADQVEAELNHRKELPREGSRVLRLRTTKPHHPCAFEGSYV